jgi:thiamine kinase-like enzyme
MAKRLTHDTAFAIASELTKKMDCKLVTEVEPQEFHRLVYETCKAAIERHDTKRDREMKRVHDLNRGADGFDNTQPEVNADVSRL